MTAKKGTPSHYRQRIDRLRRRAAFLRERIARGVRSPEATSHDIAEASALEWAVETLSPWFAKDDEPAQAVDAVDPHATDPGKPTTRVTDSQTRA